MQDKRHNPAFEALDGTGRPFPPEGGGSNPLADGEADRIARRPKAHRFDNSPCGDSCIRLRRQQTDRVPGPLLGLGRFVLTGHGMRQLCQPDEESPLADCV